MRPFRSVHIFTFSAVCVCFRSLTFVSRRFFWFLLGFVVVVGFCSIHHSQQSRCSAAADADRIHTIYLLMFIIWGGEHEEMFAIFPTYYGYAFAFGRFVFEHFPLRFFFVMGWATNMHLSMHLCNYYVAAVHNKTQQEVPAACGRRAKLLWISRTKKKNRTHSWRWLQPRISKKAWTCVKWKTAAAGRTESYLQ